MVSNCEFAASDASPVAHRRTKRAVSMVTRIFLCLEAQTETRGLRGDCCCCLVGHGFSRDKKPRKRFPTARRVFRRAFSRTSRNSNSNFAPEEKYSSRTDSLTRPTDSRIFLSLRATVSCGKRQQNRISSRAAGSRARGIYDPFSRCERNRIAATPAYPSQSFAIHRLFARHTRLPNRKSGIRIPRK